MAWKSRCAILPRLEFSHNNESRRVAMDQEAEQLLQSRVRLVETLIESIEASKDTQMRDTARNLYQIVLELHGAGLAEILRIISENEVAGRAILDAIAKNDLASSLLLLHDLHPTDLRTRVEQALGKLRIQLIALGISVESFDVGDHVVQIRCKIQDDHRPPPLGDIQSIFEQEVLAVAPEITEIELTGLPDEPVVLADGRIALPILGNQH